MLILKMFYRKKFSSIILNSAVMSLEVFHHSAKMYNFLVYCQKLVPFAEFSISLLTFAETFEEFLAFL